MRFFGASCGRCYTQKSWFQQPLMTCLFIAVFVMLMVALSLSV